jgi:hypothetical protein
MNDAVGLGVFVTFQGDPDMEGLPGLAGTDAANMPGHDKQSPLRVV